MRPVRRSVAVWKKLDHAIEAFNILGYPLRIIGTGSTLKKLKNISGPNIDYLGFVDESKFMEHYVVIQKSADF